MPLPSEPRDEVFHLDPNATISRLTAFIQEEVSRAGRQGVVLGLSGGVDSSLVAHLAVRALGPRNVHGYLLPFRTSSGESFAHARLEADKLGIETQTVEITGPAEALFRVLPSIDQRRMGNAMARVRMIVLYDRSEEYRALVIGTSNRTETLLGYGTLHGDAAWGINPIGDLYKTQVRQLARAVGVDASIVDKPPTADLWVGQTDEGEMGVTYDLADRVLYLAVDLRMAPAQIVELGYPGDSVDRVFKMVKASEFKRCMPPVAKIGIS